MNRIKYSLAALSLILALALAGCAAPSGPEPVDSPVPEVTPSVVPETEKSGHTYSDEEVAQAKAAAEAEFANLTGCTLVSMDYDPSAPMRRRSNICLMPAQKS